MKHQTLMYISMEQFTLELLLIYKRERAPITISVQENYAYLLESDIISKKKKCNGTTHFDLPLVHRLQNLL